MPITVKDLPDLTGTDTQPEPFLYCEACGTHCSANVNDYFCKPADDVFECCGEPMRLVTAKTTYTDWKKPSAKSVPV
jgi:hypothetical protein